MIDLIDKEKLINDSKFIFEISDLEFSLIKNNSLIKFNFYNSKEIEINFIRKKYILSNNSKINLEWFDTIEKFIVFYNNFNNENNSNNFLSNLNYYFSEFSIQQIEQRLKKNIKNSVKKTLRNNLIDSYNKLTLTTFGQDNSEFYNLKPKDFFQKYFAILVSYPVLTRLLFNEINKNINFYSIVLKRVDEDIKLISRKFFDNKNIRLINISQPLSDSHNGSYVIKLFFDNGKMIVYKPKKLSGEELYQEIIDYVNPKLKSKIKSCLFLDLDRYGYVEYIEYKLCENKNQRKNFYKLIGHQLAIMYLINGIDFHHENIIANLENPVFVDLETLCFNNNGFVNKKDLDNAFQKADSIIRNSVLGTGILPLYQYGEIGRPSYDVSGLGGEVEQQYPFKMIGWKNEGELDTEPYLYYPKIESKQNIPTTITKSEDYLIDESLILDSFKEAYFLIINNKNDVFKIITKYKFVHFRHIMRSTKTYYKLLERVIHPKFLKNGIDFSIEFEVLNRAMKSNIEADITQSEISQLCDLNIPIFYQYPNKKDIYSYDKILVSNYFTKTSIKQIENNLSQKVGIGIQLKFIKSALKEKNKKDTYLLKYKELANVYEENIIYGKNNSFNYLTYLYNGKHNSFAISPLNRDLYGGLIGVIIGSSDLQITDKIAYFIQNFSSVSFKSLILKLGIGVYDGAFSILYGLLYIDSHIYKISNIYEIISITIESITFEEIISSKIYDQLSGISGVLNFLIYYNLEGRNDILIKKLAKFLYDSYSYNNSSFGFAHGNAGIGYALYISGKKLNKVEYVSKGEDFIIKDIENLINKDNYNWCRGISGIGLICLKLSENDIFKSYLKTIVEKIEKIDDSKLEIQSTLCCGYFGFIDFIIELQKNNMLERSGDFISNFDALTTFQTETPNEGIYNLGLFRGISGYFYIKKRRKNIDFPSLLII